MKNTILILCLLGVMRLTALPQDSAEYYVIASGDSAAAICRKFQIPIEQLVASNPGLNVERLSVGQRVRIREKGDSKRIANTEPVSRTDSISQRSEAAGQASSARESSPMYAVTADDKTFLGQLQKAVQTNDIEWLASVVQYPITVKQNNRSVALHSSNDFKKYSSAILTPNLKLAIQKQSPDTLFKNWRGVMIGNGVIWFELVEQKTDGINKWVHRIIGINPEDRSPPKEQK